MELLRDARDHAGLTQRELARRAGTSQAMVARIERGQQSPSIATLDRLVRACGLDLTVETSGGDLRSVPAEARGCARVLVWRSGDNAYAFPLDAVERIVELTEVRRLPGQATGTGVVTVDGRATTALDAAHALGIASPAPAQIVVVRVADGQRAIIVDRAEALADEMPIAPAPPGSRAAPYVVGLADIGGEQVVVLDPDGFCAASPSR
ncbi:MAG: helix-turn-helix domain-containing protein [Gaiellales bacterium]